MFIRNRYDGSVVMEGEDARKCVEAIIDQEGEITHLDLSTANLSDVDFQASKIHDCIFMRANLSHADLSACTCTKSEFNAANLTNANLSSTTFLCCDFYRADLRGANASYFFGDHLDLRGTHWEGARIPWNNRQVLAEILRNHAEEDVDQLQVAGLVLLSRQCWDFFLNLNTHPQFEWAIQTLLSYRQPNDGFPTWIFKDFPAIAALASPPPAAPSPLGTSASPPPLAPASA